MNQTAPPLTPPAATADPAATRAGSTRPARPSRSAAVLSVQAKALAHDRFDAAAAAVVNHLALTLGCERVSLGLYTGARLQVIAVSGASDVRVRQSAVRHLAAAMAEALEQRLAIVHPLPPGASPALTLAHQQLAQSNGQAAIYSVPIATRHEVLGALVFERARGFDVPMLEAARDAAMFAGPLLAMQQRAQAGVGHRLGAVLRLRSAARLPFGRGSVSPLAVASAVGALALVGVLLVPITHNVVAPARVEGAVQQVIAAPVDGFIGSVAVRPGEAVKAGQVLATLDARELTLERDKWAAEAAQLDKQYREALSKDEASPIVMARAKLEQAQSQFELAQRQLERATLRAPMDGILLAGDLSQSVGMPAKRGQELMTIAPDRGWRIVAEVEEQAVAPLREGQHGQVLFAAVAGEPLRFAVARIAPVATQADGQNVFEVEGTPQGNAGALRPGMRGIARIELGERALGAIWWERASQGARRLAWRLFG